MNEIKATEILAIVVALLRIPLEGPVVLGVLEGT
jgi:hypothetical protein